MGKDGKENPFTGWASGKRISRRTFFQGTGIAGGGLAAAAIVGCGGSEEKKPRSVTASSGITKSPDIQTPIATKIPTPEPTRTPEEEPIKKENFFLAYTRIEESEEPGFSIVNVGLGIYNDSDELASPYAFTQPDYQAIITAADGSEYFAERDEQFYFGSYDQGDFPLIPPGFSARFRATYANDALVSYDSQIPTNVAGNLTLLLLENSLELNLQEDIKIPKYPTERPDSDFMDIGNATILVPQGNNDNADLKLTFDSFSAVAPNRDLLDPNDPYKLYLLKGTAQNQSQIYRADPASPVFQNALMFGDDGGIYLGGDWFHTQTNSGGWSVPFVWLAGLDPGENSVYGLHYKERILDQKLDPGQTIQFEVGVIVDKAVNKAKLVLPSVDGAIINLNF